MTDEEWDLVPLDTIRDVLARRFDSIVIVGCRDEGPEGRREFLLDSIRRQAS